MRGLIVISEWILYSALVVLLIPAAAIGKDKKGPPADTIEASFWSGAVALEARPDLPMWKKARPVHFQHDVNGDELVGNSTTVRAVWTKDELWILFGCGYEKLTIGPDPQGTKETDKLWTKSDVAEAFIAPNPADIMRYKEFQVSPAGEWVDLTIDRETKNHDATWRSGFRVAAYVDSGRETWWGVMAIPLKSFGVTPPEPGIRWRLNFFRMEQGPPKRLIAWQPTHQPNFHVPQFFGWIEFKK